MENIRLDLSGTGWGGEDWTDVAQDRDQWRAFVNMEINLRAQSNVGILLSSCISRVFSRMAHVPGVR
jgi:hypothetical protein